MSVRPKAWETEYQNGGRWEGPLLALPGLPADRLQVFAPLWALTPSQQKLKWERDVLAFSAHLPTNLKWPTVNFAV